MFNNFDYGKKYFYIHIMKYVCLQTCSLERNDLLFGKTCASQDCYNSTYLSHLTCLSHMLYILNTGNIHLINCTSILHHNHKEDVHVFIMFIIHIKLKLHVKA